MIRRDENLELRLARGPSDVMAAQRLRYRVFVSELGGDGELVDHDAGLEVDRFDPYCEHLILIDRRRDAAAGDHVVGVYRMMSEPGADRAGAYYSETEFDLQALRGSGRKLLELGRSCVDVDYRGSGAMFLLWNGLARYLAEKDIEILFGVASFHG
ncbi:MAG: GNAT family N-acetyltransferase, partial [Marinosulfonomonas sp.]|nr:GNAT family N-acetyltransferase [Marinosulfonomonas sp.]